MELASVSSYMVIRSVSEALRQVLWNALSANPVTQPLIGVEEGIVFENPTDTAQDNANRLSLWLYQVVEDEFLKNQPMERGATQDAEGRYIDRFPPMALDLNYLLTPFAPTPGGDHLVLGLAMQTMYDNATMVIVDEEAEVFEEARVILNRHSLEELTRIWDALKEPYRLSVCYQVKIMRVDSQRLPSTGRVIEVDAGHGAVPERVTV